MSRIVKIASWKGEHRASVVFVHGLHGHVYRTWRRGADGNTFWPVWLAQDVEGLAVYSLAYEAPISNWLGTSMPLQDRAVNIFETLLTEPGLRTGPIVFVCHSLGGLIVKKVLLNLQQQAARRPEAADLLDRVTGIVFAATPHTGSAHATWIDRLRFLAWPSSLAQSLVANDPGLRDINVAYRGMADDRRSRLRHQIFYETRATSAGTIVDEASSDPGLPGDPPVPIDADHRSIVRPESRSSLLYARVRQFVELVPAAAEDVGEVELAPLPAISSDRSFNPIPKLIRIAALALVALIAFKGVQALMVPALDIAAVQRPLFDQLAEKDRQIAEQNRQNDKLIAMLDDKRTTPAPPGADQELKKTVIAIGEGAKVDSRYAQALELLKAGKPSEAEPLLTAVAEDKVTRATSASKEAISANKEADAAKKEAAAAYRNLASIAAVSDPGRARDALAKAAQLDPDDIQGLYWNGVYQLEAGQIDVAQAAYERVISLAGAGDTGWVSWAQGGLGDIRFYRGDLPGALTYYRDGLGIMDNFAKSDPGNIYWQRDRSMFFEKIGNVQVAQGDLPGALSSYGDSLAISDRLAKSDPDNAGWQQSLAESFHNIGYVQMEGGDLQDALGSYRKALAIMDKLAKSQPGNRRWQRDLSLFINNIADALLAHGDLAEALVSYTAGFEIEDKLAKSDPSNANLQRDLSLSFARIGDVRAKQDDRPAAIRIYRDGLAIADRLAKSNPGNVVWQDDVALFFQKIGDAQAAQGELPEALNSYGDSLAITARLAKADPVNSRRQRDHALTLVRLASVQKKQNEKAKAQDSFGQARDIILRQAARSPEDAKWKRDLDALDKAIGELSR